MGWLIALLIILLIGFLPVGVSAEYDESGAGAWLTVWPVRFRLYPGKAKGKKKDKRTPKESFEKKKTVKKGGKYTDFLPLLRNILDLLLEFRRRFRVSRLEMKLTLADSDPCDLAVNYGKTWAAVGNLMPLLEQVFIIKKREVEVQCDFAADKTLVYARIDISITVGRLLYIVVFHGSRILKKFISITNQRKGGVKS